MARTRKRKPSKRDRYASFADLADETEEDADLPKDEAGRRKIKRQYVDLLGIRIEKLRGRILNRERINKTIEGIYFICAKCMKVCHSLDDGLVEDPSNQNNLCGACSKPEPAMRRPARPKATGTPARRKGRTRSRPRKRARSR
jgi:hypothetical protein